MDRGPPWAGAEPGGGEQHHLGWIEDIVGLLLAAGHVEAVEVLSFDLHQDHVVQGTEVGLSQVDQSAVLVEEQCESVTLEDDLSKHHLARVASLDLVHLA